MKLRYKIQDMRYEIKIQLQDMRYEIQDTIYGAQEYYHLDRLSTLDKLSNIFLLILGTPRIHKSITLYNRSIRLYKQSLSVQFI
jgi:hypothetical protein